MKSDWRQLYRPEKCAEESDPLAFSKTALDHVANPRHVGRVEDFHGMGQFGDPSCGDYLELTLKINEDDRVSEIGFLVYGCAGAIATSSMVCQLVRGATIREALKLTDQDVIDELGGLPESKRHCSLLGLEALRLALADALFGRDLIRKGEVADYDEYRQLRKSGKIRFDYGPTESGKEGA